VQAEALPLIVNAAAGKGCTPEDYEHLRAAFRAAGTQARVVPARSGAEVETLARQAAREGHAVVVACGGDGTVSTVAGAIVDTAAALGIVPLGTWNHFAKDLGIPLGLDEAARTIVAGHRAAVDVGDVNGHVFVNNSSLGLYPTIVLKRESQRRRLGRSKWHAFFWASMSVLDRHPMLDVRLCLDAVAQSRRTPFVFIGNNVYEMEGFDVGSRERLDAGILSLYLTQRTGRRGLIGLAFRALFGTLHQAKDFEALTAHTIGIATRHARLPVATDGEVNVLDMPLEYRIRRGALKVIVPARSGNES